MSEEPTRNSSPLTIISNILLSPTTNEISSATHEKLSIKKLKVGGINSQRHSECLIESTVLPNDNDQQYHHPNRFIPPGREGNYSPPKIAPKRRLSGSNGDIYSKRKLVMIGRDESYPEELSNLIKPLFCELCNSQLNSPKTANVHYQSKVHDKNLKAWLARNYTEKGLEAPTIKRFYRGDEGRVGPDAYHCECCDLKLTSKLHAEQHYNGRKHQSVLANASKPSGCGYYDADGKWVRTATKAIPVGANDGRFGIGEGFIQDPPVADDSQEKSSAKNEEKPIKEPPESLTCKVCNISVTSSVDMNIHLEGAKHRKKLKSCGDQSIDIGIAQPPNSLLSSLKENEISTSDVSIYRTPTGSFYCKTCDLSMTHQCVLLQHLKGKKHIKKLAKDNSAAN